MSKKIILYTLSFLVILASCSKDFGDMNQDMKHPAVVSGAVLFTDAQIKLADEVSSTNVNTNTWKLMAQYWTERSYVDESNYNIVNRRVSDNIFLNNYRILRSLNEAAGFINAEKADFAHEKVNKANRLAIIELMEIFVFQRLVDTFGDIPYSEALDSENYTPKYDDAQTIYKDLIARAKNAVAKLDESEDSFGNADLLYSGDVALWQKFGNSLLLKLGVAIADGPLSALGKSTVEGVYTKVFSELGEGAYFPYQQSLPYVNPLYLDLVASGRSDFIIPNTIWDIMSNLSDPRINDFFSNTGGIAVAYGAKGGSYSSKIHYNSQISEPDFIGFIMTYDEVLFYLSESAARGWSVGETAEVYFNAAVTSSIEVWGGTEKDASDYLTAHPYTSYSSWKKAIGTQAWLAMYTRGFEGYTFARRLDFPVLNMPPSPPVGVDVIPTRFTYPINEQTINAVNYKAASTAIGGDKLMTKIFWDVN